MVTWGPRSSSGTSTSRCAIAGDGDRSVSERRGGRRRRHDLESLIEVAVRVFAERGYDATSIDDVARAAGIAKSSVFHHVESKERLLELCLERAVARFQAIERDAVLNGGTAMERLRTICATVLGAAAEQDPALALARRLPWMTSTAPWALERYRKYELLTGRCVREAVEEGSLRSDVDPLLLSRFFWLATAAAGDIHRLDPGRPMSELVDVAIDLLLRGMERR